ncbi:MAG: CaiB/BaiF CoA-transferase family protein [Desulfomonilaceae bacterium]|nr:CaiB/BaiF CoA-transferase family protein [Desulfomonilaceae bacterium]
MSGFETLEVLMGALDGLRIVELNRLLPGAFCTALLADHGADVIVVEAPRFRDDAVVGEVPMVRRNKRHMALDLKTETGRKVFLDLIEDADVMVEAFRPGAAERLGLGYEALSRLNPRLIYCSLTGYGQSGPLADRAGHDLNFMAVSGMLDLMRDGQGAPIVPKFQMSHLSGSLYAALGIMLALSAREKTGRGQYIDVSMTDALVSLLAMPLSFTFTGTPFAGRVANDLPESFPCYRVYKTGDGEHISVGPLEPHLWAGLCAKLGCPQYATLQYDAAARAEIEQHLEGLFLEKSLREWEELLNDRDDCTAAVTRVSDLPRDAHLSARHMIHTTPEGIPEPGIAPVLSDTPGSFRRPAYRFGEHTAEILCEMGYSPEEITVLTDKGVIRLLEDTDESR